MRNRQIGQAGGLVAINRGEITNCCSLMKINAGKKTTGGLVGENAGKISASCYSGESRRLSGGVFGSGAGEVKNSYYFHSGPDSSKRLGLLKDPSLARGFGTVSSAEDAQALGFDTESRWKYIGGPQVMMFNSESWFFDVSKSRLYSRCFKKPLVHAGPRDSAKSEYENIPQVKSIHTAQELIAFAEKVNAGDPEAVGGYIRLEDDIDLSGMAWKSIGNDPSKAFKGLFDGNGHTVSNFVVNVSDSIARGLFGHLKGEVYNLNVDCVVQGGSGVTAGGVAAYCDGGVIGCCGVVAEIKGRGVNLGGLAGVNTGTIFHSYTAGTISSGAVPWVLLAPVSALIVLAILIPALLSDLPIFAPVPFDDGIRPIGDVIDPRTGRNFVTVQFEREIDVNLATGQGQMSFMNPGTSNQNVVVQIHFTDAQAVRIMGSTGRDAGEQQRLRDNPQYDPENHRTVIAQSGAIPPGHQLDYLTLAIHPDGAALPPGQHSAIAYLIFYDIHTNNRAMMESQFPVTINAHSGV
ncbi:MAG: hypothetical protein FWE32_01760 [Oscillospiraceae bacterium]|nr:hypothetical protein [Oscillospiraceae bacterium]